MKTPWKTLLVAGSLAAFGLGATAQMGYPMDGHESMFGMHHGQKFSSERMQARVTKHLAELKNKLHISASQEPAWTTFTAAMKPPATPPLLAELIKARLPGPGKNKSSTKAAAKAP